MVINSVPIDDMNTIVFAIRGTQSFRDWTVNLKTHPTSARDFLDDAGNLCHAGFLYVARKMLQPVAARLKELLKEDPNRASCSLLITGHSAGGAIASLLYCHMLSRTVRSDLTHLRGFFKRIHCVTFGAPPVSLLPLDKPSSSEYRKAILSRGPIEPMSGLFWSYIFRPCPVRLSLQLRSAVTVLIRRLISLRRHRSLLPGTGQFQPRHCPMPAALCFCAKHPQENIPLIRKQEMSEHMVPPTRN
jgi:lipase (class 3)